MNYNSLRYFVKLAEMEHYANAAKELFISQPSLSYAITKLEEDLGVPLFEKDGRNVHLSKYGKIFYECVASGLGKINEGVGLMRQFSSAGVGTISLASLYIMGSSLVPKLVKKFSEIPAYSNTRFVFGQGSTSFVIDGLKKGHYDIGLASFATNEPGMQFISILKQPLILITATNHPLSTRETVTVAEILEYPLITYNRQTTGEIRYLIDSLFVSYQKKPHTSCEFEEESSIANMVVSDGECVAIVPDVSVLNAFAVKKIPLANVNLMREIYLIRVKGRFLPASSEAFFDFIRSCDISDFV